MSMAPTGSFSWLLWHEARLLARALPGKELGSFYARNKTLIFWGAVLSLLLHAIAVPFAKSLAAVPLEPGPVRMMSISFFILIGFTILVARSLDGVTQLLYARADLDLLLSSPLSQNRVFSARLVSVAVQTVFPSLFFTAPFAHVAALKGDPRWLAIYPLVIALTALATACAAGLANLLFAAIGARRTRIVAQVVATLLATGIGVGMQLGKLLPQATQEDLSEWLDNLAQSSAFAADSPLVWPARGLLGGAMPMLALLAFAAGALLLTGHVLARHLAANAVVAMGADMGRRDAGSRRKSRSRTYFGARPDAALRRKEWMVALRSPWLLGELLTPLLYLVPPVLVLARTSGDNLPPLWLMASAIAMLAGQVAAGFSRLMISGEDAPELVATAPVTQGARDRAKVAAVCAASAALMALPLALVFWHSPFAGLWGLAGSVAAVLAVCGIHLWFRAEARRPGFQGRAKVPMTVSIADPVIGLLIATTAGFGIRFSPWAAVTGGVASVLMYMIWRRRDETAA